ncbi:MAG: zinc-dependent peptidase, partial [Fulvivirga sp.]|uniref:zinc-dependent peptidase n=1 Tax=Fulvivirga sp. TaxID=1931237 RepID=UPI0032EFE9D6
GAPILVLIYGVWSVFNDFYIFIYDEVRYHVKVRQPLYPKYRNILNQYCAYYKVLSASDKIEFERKLRRFMYSKKFIPRGIPMVTPEMRVLISASAIQLTFRLPEIYLSNFDKILIYPNEYYSHINKRYHLGEVNPRAGIIVLSWKAFVQGYGDLRDSYNLGIHEMAHAIHFENRIKNEEFEFLNREALFALDKITMRELEHIRAGKDHLLRAYAGTNEYEFFAVSLEYFFEQPQELKQAHPDLYETLKTLLNQDPLKLYKFDLL